MSLGEKSKQFTIIYYCKRNQKEVEVKMEQENIWDKMIDLEDYFKEKVNVIFVHCGFISLVSSPTTYLLAVAGD